MIKPAAAERMPHGLAIVVCGLFHYRYHVDSLARWKVLAGVYFSHRFNSLRTIEPALRHNLFFKEYLLHAHLKTLNRRALRVGSWLYRQTWAVGTRLLFKPAAVNLVLLNGSCRVACEMCKQQGRLLIGEVVNAHPEVAHARLEQEARRIGIPNSDPWTQEQSTMLQELTMADFLLCPSKATADSYVAHGFPRQRTKVIPYGVPAVARRDRPSARRGPGLTIKLLCVAQIALRKGQHLLLEGIGTIAHQLPAPVDVTLIGHGDDRYLRLLRTSPVPFRYVRNVPNADLLELMQDYDVLVLPSLEDGFGMVVTEAVGAGLPVLVSHFAGAAEWVDAMGGGATYDPRDPASLLAGLLLVVQGRHRPFVAAGSGWEDYAAKLVEWAGECVQQFEPAKTSRERVEEAAS